MDVSPEVGPGLFQPPRRDKALAAEGVEQKAIMRDEGKQPSPKDPVLKRALSHPNRQAMLSYLMEKQGTETDEAELIEALDLSAPRVKYHLSALQGADLIAHADDSAQGYVAAASASP